MCGQNYRLITKINLTNNWSSFHKNQIISSYRVSIISKWNQHVNIEGRHNLEICFFNIERYRQSNSIIWATQIPLFYTYVSFFCIIDKIIISFWYHNILPVFNKVHILSYISNDLNPGLKFSKYWFDNLIFSKSWDAIS